MQLNPIDWGFIIGYCVFAFAIGVIFTKRAGKNIDEFFVGGRKFVWWIAGTSIVATTFAADTPLAVSKLARTGGIYTNWFWWSGVMGGIMCVFFYARLWRRARVITDVEFIELRYEGKSASALRGFMAIYTGVLQNCITMGWVILAMTKICDVMLGWPKITSIAVMMVITVAYSVLSGFWGVVLTDLVQFVMSMVGSISLAAIVVCKMGGFGGMVEQVQAAPGFEPKIFHFIPDLATAAKLAVVTFVVQISVQWWGSGQGSGFLAQRLFSTSNERQSALSALWFNFAHYVLRPWPWIIVGLASLVFFPELSEGDAERAYPMMIVRFLPTGLRGLMVASLIAAFMSTMDTQMNWGSSYVINDVYKRFIVKDAPPKHYVTASRYSVLLLAALGALTAYNAETITGAWVYLAKLTAGAGVVGLLRWYWWRVNPWSEISALTASFMIANGKLWAKMLNWLGWMPPKLMERIEWLYGEEAYAVCFLVIVVVCTAIWLIVTFLTSPVSDEHLEKFFRRVRPAGWWGPIAQKCPDVNRDDIRYCWLGWLSGVVCIYTGLFGIGHICLARYLTGWILVAVCIVSGLFMISRVPKTE